MPPSRSRTSSRPTTSLPAEQADEPAKKPDLTVTKVIAGAGAAATSAAFGSFFGASGTVAGAAFGSVVLTIGNTLYQRSLERTAETVRARIRVMGPARSGVVERPLAGTPTDSTVPLPRVSPEEPETVLLAPSAPQRPARRHLAVLAGVAVLIFALGLLVVTGLEWAKGSTLAGGEAGTSIGRVLDPAPPPVEDGAATEVPADEQQPTDRDEEAGTSAEPTEGPDTAESTPSAEPESPEPSGQSGDGATGGGASEDEDGAVLDPLAPGSG
jgi:hypothetical protein